MTQIQKIHQIFKEDTEGYIPINKFEGIRNSHLINDISKKYGYVHKHNSSGKFKGYIKPHILYWEHL